MVRTILWEQPDKSTRKEWSQTLEVAHFLEITTPKVSKIKEPLVLDTFG